ncbi:hypothetical protein D3C87_1863340 [compost metagenome]
MSDFENIGQIPARGNADQVIVNLVFDPAAKIGAERIVFVRHPRAASPTGAYERDRG